MSCLAASRSQRRRPQGRTTGTSLGATALRARCCKARQSTLSSSGRAAVLVAFSQPSCFQRAMSCLPMVSPAPCHSPYVHPCRRPSKISVPTSLVCMVCGTGDDVTLNLTRLNMRDNDVSTGKCHAARLIWDEPQAISELRSAYLSNDSARGFDCVIAECDCCSIIAAVLKCRHHNYRYVL